MEWLVRQGCKGGMYLWGWNEGEYDYRYQGISQRAKPSPWWGTQGGATRYKDRVQAVRDATRANGRIVRLVRRPSVTAGA